MDAVDNLTLELWGLERLLNINELAAYLRVPVSTIYEWRISTSGGQYGVDMAVDLVTFPGR